MSTLSRVNHVLDRSCSLLVGSAVILVDAYCVLHYDASMYVPVFTANACCTAGLSRGLKRLINQSRPPGAPKLSPGMPSNHATTLAFLCVSTVTALQKYYERTLVPGFIGKHAWRLLPVPTVPDIPVGAIRPLQILLLVYSLYVSHLRVVCGHHTLAQVVAGYAFGASSAALCLVANYAGYPGMKPGGRVDELSFPMRTVVVVITSIMGLLTARSIYRGATRKHAFSSPTSPLSPQ